VPVLPNQNDWVHMQTLKPILGAALASDQPDLKSASAGLQHYAAHWSQGVNKKTLPKEQINEEKKWIAAAEKALVAHQERAALAQQAMAMEQQAMAQAQQLVQSGQV
jgi:hypothetical protein